MKKKNRKTGKMYNDGSQFTADRVSIDERFLTKEKITTQRVFHSLCRNINTLNNLNIDDEINGRIDELTRLVEELQSDNSDKYYYGLLKILSSNILSSKIDIETAIFELINTIDPSLLIYKIASSDLEKEKKIEMITDKFNFFDSELLRYEKMIKELNNTKKKVK